MTSVSEICKAHNGVTTWGFSQSDLSVVYHIFSNPATRWGICAALSAYWIERHAHDGSLANELGGGGVGPLKVGKIKEIAMLHGHVSMRGDRSDQHRDLGLWLKMHDLLPLHGSEVLKGDSKKVKGMSPTRNEFVASTTGAIANIEGNMVRGMQKFSSCYLRLNFGGNIRFKGEGGHAVAVWLGGRTYGSAGDALFFDPTYGEFWFESKADFFRFFPVFYKAKYLSGLMNFNTRWEILPCALRAY